MTDELVDTTVRCVCGATEGLVRGWCPACLPAAIDDLMQRYQDADDTANDALHRLDHIAEWVERERRRLGKHTEYKTIYGLAKVRR